MITGALGDAWITDLRQLRGLENHAADAGFQAEFQQVKRANKVRLAQIIKDTLRLSVDPDSLFDIQVKRIHTYKRQLLNVMHIIDEYLSLIDDGRQPAAPRTYIFSGKAAPGYWLAKQMIKLIHNVGKTINNDPRASQWMKVVFIPDYGFRWRRRSFPRPTSASRFRQPGRKPPEPGT